MPRAGNVHDESKKLVQPYSEKATKKTSRVMPKGTA